MGYKFFDTKIRSVINVNEKLDKEIQNQQLKISKEETSMWDLKKNIRAGDLAEMR